MRKTCRDAIFQPREKIYEKLGFLIVLYLSIFNMLRLVLSLLATQLGTCPCEIVSQTVAADFRTALGNLRWRLDRRNETAKVI